MSTKGGKGSSSAETTNNVSNEQVATQSGIAVGGNGNTADINVQTSDPEVVEAALKSNTDVSGHANDVVGSVAEFTTQASTQLAGLALGAQNDLATKFGAEVSSLAAQNIDVLNNVAGEQTDTTNNALKTANDALDQSFAVSKSVAPQDASYAEEQLTTTNSKTILYVVAGFVVLVVGFFLIKKKQ